MSMISNKLKEELTDVGKVYNSGSCIISHPNSFDRLQTEIMKICNEKVNLEKQLENAKTLIMKLSIALDAHHTNNLEYKLIQDAELFLLINNLDNLIY